MILYVFKEDISTYLPETHPTHICLSCYQSLRNSNQIKNNDIKEETYKRKQLKVWELRNRWILQSDDCENCKAFSKPKLLVNCHFSKIKGKQTTQLDSQIVPDATFNGIRTTHAQSQPDAAHLAHGYGKATEYAPAAFHTTRAQSQPDAAHRAYGYKTATEYAPAAVPTPHAQSQPDAAHQAHR